MLLPSLTPAPALARALRPFALIVLAVAISGRAAAHETWLVPDTFAPEPGAALTLRLTSGMGFPALASGIAPERVREAVLLQGGEKRELQVGDRTDGALEFSTVTTAGDACIWVAVKPRVLELDAADVDHYLDEIGAGEAVWDTWNAQAAPRSWRESYAKLARSQLRGGQDVPGGACWRAPSGARFEILPQADPTALSPGAELEFRVLFDGEPLGNQAVGLVREGAEPAPLTRSDAQGRLALTFDEPGRYMVYATQIRPAAADSHNWESDFFTLTLDVPAP